MPLKVTCVAPVKLLPAIWVLEAIGPVLGIRLVMTGVGGGVAQVVRRVKAPLSVAR